MWLKNWVYEVDCTRQSIHSFIHNQQSHTTSQPTTHRHRKQYLHYVKGHSSNSVCMYESISFNCHCLGLVSIRTVHTDSDINYTRKSLAPKYFRSTDSAQCADIYTHLNTNWEYCVVVYTSECPFKRSNVNTKFASKFFRKYL